MWDSAARTRALPPKATTCLRFACKVAYEVSEATAVPASTEDATCVWYQVPAVGSRSGSRLPDDSSGGKHDRIIDDSSRG